MLRCVLIVWVLLCTACASNFQSKTPLYSHAGFHETKKDPLEPTEITASKRVHKEGYAALQLEAENQPYARHLVLNYADEYMHYIDRYLNGDFDAGQAEFTLGDAHTLLPVSRLHFFVKNGLKTYKTAKDKRKQKNAVIEPLQEPLLAIEYCNYGYCRATSFASRFDRFVIYFNRAEALKLKTQLAALATQYPSTLATFQPVPPAANKARIYLYRLRTAPLAGPVRLKANDQPLLKIKNNQCFYFDIDPQTYTITGPTYIGLFFTEPYSLSINAKAGETYFVKYSSKVGRDDPDPFVEGMLKIFSDRIPVKLEPPMIALKDIAECSPLEQEG